MIDRLKYQTPDCVEDADFSALVAKYNIDAASIWAAIDFYNLGFMKGKQQERGKHDETQKSNFTR